MANGTTGAWLKVLRRTKHMCQMAPTTSTVGFCSFLAPWHSCK